MRTSIVPLSFVKRAEHANVPRVCVLCSRHHDFHEILFRWLKTAARESTFRVL